MIPQYIHIENTLHVNLDAVQWASDNNLIREYAVFLKLKAINSKSCIFSYTQSSLAAKANMSRSAVRKYVKTFLELKWCRMHEGNLIFNKLKSFDTQKQKLIRTILVKDKVKDIITDLYLLLLQRKQIQFDRAKQLGRDVINMAHWKLERLEKSLEKKGNSIDTLPNAGDQLKLSVRRMSEMFGKCSIGKAAGVIKKLKQRGDVVCFAGKRTRHRYRNPMHARYLMETLKNAYCKDGVIFTVECNTYNFDVKLEAF